MRSPKLQVSVRRSGEILDGGVAPEVRHPPGIAFQFIPSTSVELKTTWVASTSFAEASMAYVTSSYERTSRLFALLSLPARSSPSKLGAPSENTRTSSPRVVGAASARSGSRNGVTASANNASATAATTPRPFPLKARAPPLGGRRRSSPRRRGPLRGARETDIWIPPTCRSAP